MKVIVAGCGKTGMEVISNLYAEGHELVAVDNDPAAIEEVTTTYDVMCVCGNAADVDVMREAGVAKCQLFVAATESDELNMLACFLAKKLGAVHTIARIRNPGYNDNGLGFVCQQLDLAESINPDRMAAKEIFNILKFPSAVKLESFSGKFDLIEIVLKEDSPLKDRTLLDIKKRNQGDYLVCAVQRDANTLIPNGMFELKQGDRVALTATPAEAEKLLDELGILQKSAKRVMIVGAGKVSYYLTKMLVAAGIAVTVIEINKEKCKSFADEINAPQVTVINGDGARQEVLLEEGLENTDAFVALTGADEENILISVFAASTGPKKIVAKVNRPELAAMAEKLGLECIISPNKIVSGKISKYARALDSTEGSNLEAVYRILDGGAEAVEFKVAPDFRYIGIPIKDLKLKTGVLIGGIIRGRKTMVPSGNDIIMNSDRVIVISSGYRLGDMSDIMLDY